MVVLLVCYILVSNVILIWLINIGLLSPRPSVNVSSGVSNELMNVEKVRRCAVTMDLKRSQKILRTMSRISLICLVLLCCLSMIFSDVLCSRAYAAVSAYDPSQYVSDITVSGEDRIVNFVFDHHEIPSTLVVRFTPSGESFSDTVTGAVFDRIYSSSGQTGFSGELFPFGTIAYTGHPVSSGVVDVSDIMPGAAISLSMDFEFRLNHQIHVSSQSATLVFSQSVLCYDKNGNYKSTLTSPATTRHIILSGQDVIDVEVSTSFTVPSDITYILPYSGLSLSMNDGATMNAAYFQFSPRPFTMSCDINMLYEQSLTMQRIDEQLGDINSGIQDANDKLDDIYTGGDAGASLGDAGDKLSGSSNDVSDAVGGMADDVGNVSDFESGQFEHIEYAFDQLTIVQDFGQFNASLAFVSGYVEDIFSELEGWQIVITLPLFIGLFFGLCQHVGGISHVRAVHAREARNEELHQARLDKIRGG